MSGRLKQDAWFVLLLSLVLASAFSVISSTHQSRSLYAELQDGDAQRWYLEEEYSRLLLEQSTWASHHRIIAEASDNLGLVAPSHAQTRLLVQ